MLIAALAIRQHGPTEKPAVQLEKPAAEVEAPAPKSDEQGGG